MIDIIMGTLAACLILGVLMIWYHIGEITMIKRNQFENYAIRLLRRILIKYLKYIGKDHEHIYLSCAIIKEDGDDKYYVTVHNEHWKDGKDHDCPVDRWSWEDADE